MRNSGDRCLPLILLFSSLSSLVWVDAFLSLDPFSSGFGNSRRRNIQESFSRLFSGTGIATHYSWQEEAFEIEVTVKVPKDTRAKDIKFKALPRSIDLRLMTPDGSTKVLLDGNRTLRGRVSLDGTYWVISDGVKEVQDVYLAQPYREVTVTIEKLIRTPKDDFEVVDYDWNGVYPDDDGEVSYRKYDGPEKLDVREYAASLGVDIDNLNMSLVDKTMFTSGINSTQMDELTKAGLLTEVTQQADGSEYMVDSETGEPEPMRPLGMKQRPDSGGEKKKIPLLDTDSPWHNATTKVPSIMDENDEKSETSEKVIQQKRFFTRAAFAEDAAKMGATGAAAEDPSDPIDILTVKKLKEILKSQGLKVTGNKKELQDRLRQQVNSLLQGRQNPPPE